MALFELETFSCVKTFSSDKKSASKIAMSQNEEYWAVLSETVTFTENEEQPKKR